MAGRDFEVLKQVKPEPPSEDETRSMELLSPVDLEILGHRMQMIALEANEVLMRTAGTPAGLAGDIGSCIFTAEGDPASAAVGIWGHAFAGQLPIKYALKHWKDDPSVGINDGDAFFCNECLYGGIHGPDMSTFLPIFFEGRLIAWAQAMAHTTDTGAVDMGGISMGAKTRYDEGLKLSPIKVAEGFRLKNDIMTMMENAVRDPRVITLDNKARMAACMRMRQRVLEVAGKRGGDFVVGAQRKMIEEGSRVARERISGMNDGVFRHPVFMNVESPGPDGVESLIRLMLTLRKEGDRLTADFSGSSPETQGPFNVYSHVIHPYGTGYVCCSHLFPDLPPSLGLTEAVELKVPDGCILNPGEEAAVGAAPATAFAASQGVFSCLAKLLFDSDYRSNLVSAYPYMTLYGVWGGMDRQGNYFVTVGLDINAGGFPARTDMDGVDTGGFNVATRSDCEDAEDIDAIQSMSYLFRKQGKDNFGHGKYRGGAGLEYAYMAHKSMMMVLGCLGGCGKFSSGPGIFGGYGAPPLTGIKVEGSNLSEMMESGDPDIPTSIEELLEKKEILGGKYDIGSPMLDLSGFNEGDLFATMQGGGGGYGDVLERDPEAVIMDVGSGLVSHWAARNVYRVAFDPETLVVDGEETKRLKELERKDRIKRGVPFDLFNEEWLEKSPPAGSLELYGGWPDCM